MTREQWFAATNPDLLLNAWSDSGWVVPVARRFRLFGCACVRQVWHLLTTDARSAVQLSERAAEGTASETDLVAASVRMGPYGGYPAALAGHAAGHASAPIRNADDHPRAAYSVWDAARLSARAHATERVGPAPPGHTRKTGAWHTAWTQVYDEVRATQAQILRDIFPPLGFVYRIDPMWRTSTVVALCRQMDESGDFSIVPILADALEDAGCDDVTLLQCCRVPGGVHVRGNWVVDLVLGRG